MSAHGAQPTIAAIVVTHNTSALARECVASIAAQAHDAGGIEIVIVDSGSTDAQRTVLRDIGVRLLELDGNPGYAAAVNRGALQTRSRYLLISNADVLYLPSALARLVDAADRLKRCAAVGPVLWWDREQTLLLPPNSDERPATILRDAIERRLGVRGAQRAARRAQRIRHAASTIELPALSGASMLVARPAFERLGGFDEGFNLYFEDADFCRRARSSGYRLAQAPDAHAVHHYNQSARQNPEGAAAQFAVSARRYAAKHDRRVAGVVARTATWLRAVDPPPMVDLGVAVRPPSFTVQGSAAGQPTLFLLSPLPGCVPAAGAERPTGELVVSDEVFRRLAPGPCYVLALALPGLRVVGAWRWMKPAVEPGGTAPPPEIVIRDCEPGDAGALIALFKTVFGHEPSEDFWRWKYEAVPGMGCSQVAVIDGEVVAHAGGRSHRMAWLGEPVTGFDMGDVMSDPALRGRWIWPLMFTAFIDHHVDARRAVLVYGFPNERFVRAGVTRRGWKPVAPVSVLERAHLDPAPRIPGELTVSDRPPERWDAAWAALEPADGLLLRRDRSYLTWRYTDRPDREYRFLNALDGASLAVVAIGGERAHLMELIAPPGDAARAARLALAAEHVAAVAGATSLTAWFPSWSEQASVLAGGCGFACFEAPHRLVSNPRNAALTVDWLGQRFFYSLGDWDVH